jgi:hypothetical protein
MSQWRIEFEPAYRSTPISYWVHRNQDHDIWLQASLYDPPLPRAIPGKGFPRLIIEAAGVELEFASVEEIRHFRQILAQKNLPTTRQLSARRNSAMGPNRHWLSRLPANLKAWRKRERLLPTLDAGMRALEAVYE